MQPRCSRPSPTLDPAGVTIDLVETLADVRRDALSKVDLPASVLSDQHDGRAVWRGRRRPYVSDVALNVDRELVLGRDQLPKDESAEPLIVLALPIGKAAPKEALIEQLEPLACLQPATDFGLWHVSDIVCAKQRVDG